MKRIVLGIDPGTLCMGFGVAKAEGKQLSFVNMDILDLHKEEDAAHKLKIIFETTLLWIDKHAPDAVAIEAPFFGKNVQSMLKLGRAQGVAIAAAMVRNVPIFEYAPTKIKMAITGKGTASKEQVAAMLFRILSLDVAMPKHLDATDGLAAAVCHLLQNELPKAPTTPSKGKNKKNTKYSGWDSFLSQNSDRIIR